MSHVPENLRYTKTHEWVREDDKDLFTIGITNHAQCMLGDLVYVELPEAEVSLTVGKECAVVESVKAAADIYCPMSGEVVEINEDLGEHPHLVNEDPYGRGWLLRIRPFDDAEKAELLDAEAYDKQVVSEAH